VEAAHEFDAPDGYLNTASVGIPPRAAVRELSEGVASWAAGGADPRDYDSWVARARQSFARLVGVPAEWVATAAHVSYFVGLVAATLRPGAEVVGYRGDFTSLLFPLLQRGDLDVRLVELDEVADAVGPRTALVAVSAVQSADGRVADLDAIAASGAPTLIDATQACGWLPLDASRFDYLCVGAYKWLLSPRGSAFMSVRPERLEALRPSSAGWYAGDDPWTSLYGGPLRLADDARRLDLSPAWLCWVGAAPALEYIEAVGVERVHEHDVRLANRLLTGMDAEPADSAIASLEHPDAGPRLERAGIKAAVRAGGLRASFHLYTTEADVDRALEALATPLPR
jgi:selenocysteine lyase/cysteine desulfurase